MTELSLSMYGTFERKEGASCRVETGQDLRARDVARARDKAPAEADRAVAGENEPDQRARWDKGEGQGPARAEDRGADAEAPGEAKPGEATGAINHETVRIGRWRFVPGG